MFIDMNEPLYLFNTILMFLINYTRFCRILNMISILITILNIPSTWLRSRYSTYRKTLILFFRKQERIHLLIGILLAKVALKLLDPLTNLMVLLLSSEKFNTSHLFKQVTIVFSLVRKLKGLDIPDVLQAVKSKKLPK